MRRRLLDHPALRLPLVGLLALLGYAPALGRGLVSEDFVILRQIATTPFWETCRQQLTGPWLGVTFVSFYRPVSTLLLQLEARLWGVAAAGYVAAHFALHLLAAALVYALARELGREAAPGAAGAVALLFALYPLHPNTVVFVASFATLFAAVFLLAALLAFRRGADRTALALYLLALGCYEQAVVLPVLLAAHALLAPAAPAERRLRRHLPFWGATALYLVVRRLALGQTVGGYEDFRQLWASPPAELGGRLARGHVHLVVPRYAQPVTPWVLALAVAAVVGGTLWSLLRLRRGGPAARGWLLGMVWIYVTQAPFAFVGVVPGNGRYWYLASIGLALAAVAAAEGAARWGRLPRGLAVAALALLLGGCYLVLLRGYATTYRHAADTALDIRRQVEKVAATPFEGFFFLTGYPYFLDNPRGVPLAQVFHWGLADALAPPFTAHDRRVMPLPPFDAAALAPLLARPELGPVWRWHAGRLAPLGGAAAPPPPRIPVRWRRRGGLDFTFRGPPGRRYRLVLLTRGNPTLMALPTPRSADAWSRATLPPAVVASMARLYGDRMLWWVEARDAADRCVAASRLHTVDAGLTGRSRERRRGGAGAMR